MPSDSAAGIQAMLNALPLEILALVTEGLSNAEIASRLYLTESTVKWHVRKICGGSASPTGRRRWRGTCRRRATASGSRRRWGSLDSNQLIVPLRFGRALRW